MTADPRGLSRRAFLAATVAAAAAACADGAETSAPKPTTTADPTAAPDLTATPNPTPEPTSIPEPTPTTQPPPVDLAGDPFTLGVASGDPTDSSVILWTRLAHSVHVDAGDLEPDSGYSYRFRVGQYSSPIGRTRTLPDRASSPAALTFAFSSCQHYEAGFYAAHRHLANEQVDLFVWLGDYIYESGPIGSPLESADGEPRVHNSDEISDLVAYRNRYALYKGDPDHTLLGLEQETWVTSQVVASSAKWKVLTQQVMMHGLSVLPGQDPPLVVTDTWDGYYGNRKRILETFQEADVDNLVVLTGDFHATSVGDLKPDPFEAASPVVATEFMATSISSTFPEAATDAAPLILLFNPQIKFFDARKGYTICTVTGDEWVATYKALEDPTNQDSTIAPIAAFAVASGTPGAIQQ